MLAGCGAQEEAATPVADVADAVEEAEVEEAVSELVDAAVEEEVAEAVGEIDFDDDPVELKVALMCLAPMGSDQTDHIEEALNEISLEKINATVDYEWYDGGSYTTQVPMMLQAGEQLDLIMFTPIPAAGYQSFMTQNQLVDISDSLEVYGQGILKYMQPDGKNYLEATSRGDGVYGVGVLQDMSGHAAVDIRADLLRDLDLEDKARAAKSWDEINDVLKQVVEANQGMNGYINSDAQGTVVSPQPYVVGNGSFSDAEWLDTIGDSYQYIYADQSDNKVKCFFENEKWQDSVRMARQLYQDGLIYKDSSTAQDYGSTLMKNDVGAAMVHGVEMGNETTMEANMGYPDTEVDVAACKVSTASFVKFGMAVPVTTVDQDRAVALLNLIWDDPDYRDTLTWGVEGVDWVKNDDGTATYPEGINADNVKYHTNDFLYGNRLETTPWEGDGADIRDRQKAANAELEVSPFFGMSVDTSNVDTTIAALKNVVDKYYPSLCSGTVEDVDGTLKTFIDELYGAGMQDVIDEFQSQLDAWLANK